MKLLEIPIPLCDKHQHKGVPFEIKTDNGWKCIIIPVQLGSLSCKECNGELSSASLFEVSLYGADLRDVDLSGASLSRANLVNADLRGVDLSLLHFLHLKRTVLVPLQLQRISCIS